LNDRSIPYYPVPILKNGGDPNTIGRALTELQHNEELVELESLLGFFASFVLDTELVRQIMRWDMTVLRESPWYQEIRQEGKQEGELTFALRLITRRFGSIAPDQEIKIRNLSLPQLEELGEALLDFSQASDLEDWLNAHR
jgi:predicted transposase YdaD